MIWKWGGPVLNGKDKKEAQKKIKNAKYLEQKTQQKNKASYKIAGKCDQHRQTVIKTSVTTAHI